MPLDPVKVGEVTLDREQAFLLFATFCGDVERTAHALNVRPVDVLKIAEESGWLEKLGPILSLKKSQRPGDVERAMNRALNFVQAHRMRLFLERIMHKLASMNDDDIESYMFRGNDKEGGTVNKLSTRPMADLASAIEKCHAMTYLALSDTARDRAKREEAGLEGESGGELHAQIARSMAAIGSDNSARALLFDAQLEQGARLAPKLPANPLDNDNH